MKDPSDWIKILKRWTGLLFTKPLTIKDKSINESNI